jgi:hypothetical protein
LQFFYLKIANQLLFSYFQKVSFLTFFSGGGGVRLRQILERRGVHAVLGE